MANHYIYRSSASFPALDRHHPSSGTGAFNMTIHKRKSNDTMDDLKDGSHTVHTIEPMRRKPSKDYQRYLYKEPGSRVIDSDRQLRCRRNREIERSSDVMRRVFGEGRARDFVTYGTLGGQRSVTESLYSGSRLGRIVGKPVDRHNFVRANKSTIIGTRHLQKKQNLNQQVKQPNARVFDIDADCSSVVSVSDLDNLEAKALRRDRAPLELTRQDLHSLRREINSIVSTSLDERVYNDKVGSKRGYMHDRALADEELREGWGTTEGCATDGCVHFLNDGRSGVQEILDDMKEYWTVMVKE